MGLTGGGGSEHCCHLNGVTGGTNIVAISVIELMVMDLRGVVVTDNDNIIVQGVVGRPALSMQVMVVVTSLAGGRVVVAMLSTWWPLLLLLLSSWWWWWWWLPRRGRWWCPIEVVAVALLTLGRDRQLWMLVGCPVNDGGGMVVDDDDNDAECWGGGGGPVVARWWPSGGMVIVVLSTLEGW